MHPVGQFLKNYVEPFFANYLTPFIGFIIFIVILSFFVEKFGKKTNTLLENFENFLFKIKIPYLIAQLILYALVMTVITGFVLFAAHVVNFLGLL